MNRSFKSDKRLICFCSIGISWGKDESREKTFFKFRGWDGSDNRTSGLNTLNDSLMDSDTAYSLQSAKCIVLKMGCDKVAGSNLERDKCGVCRRDKRNKCVGCDGQAYSNKRWGEVLNSIFHYHILIYRLSQGQKRSSQRIF